MFITRRRKRSKTSQAATRCSARRHGGRGRRLRIEGLEDRRMLAGPDTLGDEFQVNTFTTSNQEIRDLPGGKYIAADQSGDFVAVWQSLGQDAPNTWGVYSQRFNAAGVPQGGEFRVNTVTNGHQLLPSVAMDPAGNFVVTWQSLGQDGDAHGIFGQRYNAAGVPQGGEFQINSTTTGEQIHSSVAMDASGNFVATWQSFGQDGDAHGIFGQRYNAAGVPQGGEFLVNSFTGGNQVSPSVAMDAAGNFVVTWQSRDGSGASGDGIFGQRYSAAGVAEGDEFRVNTVTHNTQAFPSVAMDPAGNFVVAWASGDQDGEFGYGVFGRRYNAAGETQGAEFQINTITHSDQVFPSVAMDPAGNFVVVWHSWDQDGSGTGIFGQRYHAEGTILGGEFQINKFVSGQQGTPSVAMDPTGKFVVVWSSEEQDGHSYGVFGQRYRSGFVLPVTLTGAVFDDSDNDGLFELGDVGLGGLTVTLTGTDEQGAVSRTTTTLADGSYSFGDLIPGTYSITADRAAGLLDGKETAGTFAGIVDNTQDSNTISGIVIGTDGTDTTGYNFANIRPSDLLGLAWQDFNNDGEVNFGERAIENVAVSLSGMDDRGNAVNLSSQTDIDGVYLYVDLRPGNYTLAEAQPDGFQDGLDIVGTVNGVPVGDNSVNDVISGIVLALPGSVAENYNFGERPPAGGEVTAGQTATIGFWQNNNGQSLIESLNSGAGSTHLASWLAATFDNMYGADAGANDLTGMSNAEVADFYSDLFRRTKKEALQLGLSGPVKMDAQVFAVALATYVTNQTLAGLTAESFGFLVTEQGVGVATLDVGDSGEAFGVADNSLLTVLNLLFATDDNSIDGVLYDLDGDGDADDDWETVLRTLANDVFSAINESGDV